MSEEKSVEPKANTDELTKTKKPSDIQLSEEELSKANGGFAQVKIGFNPES
jgi:hypothetical protein